MESIKIKKPQLQPYLGSIRATGLQEDTNTIRNNEQITPKYEKNNGLQNVTDVEDPPWYRFPSQKYRQGKRGKDFSYFNRQSLSESVIKHPPKSSPRLNGLQAVDELFPTNIHKNEMSSKKSNTETNQTENQTKDAQHQKKHLDLELQPQQNKLKLRKQVTRQTLNGVSVPSYHSNDPMKKSGHECALDDASPKESPLSGEQPKEVDKDAALPKESPPIDEQPEEVNTNATSPKESPPSGEQPENVDTDAARSAQKLMEANTASSNDEQRTK